MAKLKKSEIIIQNFLNVKDDPKMIESFTVLQNEMSVGFNNKVIAITTFEKDDIAAAFAKALGEVFVINKSKVLVIDANLYKPSLDQLLGENNSNAKDEIKVNHIGDNFDVISLNKEIYPPEIYKDGTIQKIILDSKEKYDHIILIVPTIKEHKEIYLLKDMIDAVILLCQKNITKRKDIYLASEFFIENNIPLAKTVVIA